MQRFCIKCIIVQCEVVSRLLYDIVNLKQKSSGARPICANAGRAPSGHPKVILSSDPIKRRTGAVEF